MPNGFLFLFVSPNEQQMAVHVKIYIYTIIKNQTLLCYLLMHIFCFFDVWHMDMFVLWAIFFQGSVIDLL